MLESLPYMISGVTFGLLAGISPGPLLTLVVSETLRYGRKAGVVVACAPLLTDIPIVIISILLLSKISQSNIILGIISLLGAMFILYLSYENLTTRRIELDVQSVKSYSLRKAVLTNLLSPHPYIFWVSIGGPTAIKAYKINILSAVLYIALFYSLLIGSKMVLALAVDQSRTFLGRKGYMYLTKFLGVTLVIFAILFAKEGIELLMNTDTITP